MCEGQGFVLGLVFDHVGSALMNSTSGPDANAACSQVTAVTSPLPRSPDRERASAASHGRLGVGQGGSGLTRK